MARILVNCLFYVTILGACEATSSAGSIEVLRVLPHDTTAYTQGFLFHEGRLFESTGQYGESSLREVDPETGEVLRRVDLSDEYFGEGLARVGDRLIQLTWHEGVAFVYDIETFEVVDTFTYDGDGWGLCYDGESLYMTTGGSILYRRDPETFEVLDTRQILMGNRSLSSVNELECSGGYVWANVYQSADDTIVRIDKVTGEVVEQVHGSGLTPEGGRPREAGAVLNGIAYDPSREVYYLTGKLWSSMFEVRFVP